MVDALLQVSGQYRNHARDKRLQFPQPVAAYQHDNNRNRQGAHVLLMLDASVDRDKDVEVFTGGQKQQTAVAGTRPAHLLHRAQDVRLRKEHGKPPGHGLVKE